MSIMTTRINKLRAEVQGEIGEVVERDAGIIIDRWAERARTEQANALRVHHDVLRNHLQGFLIKLGHSLSTVGDQSEEPRRIAWEHGDQRWDAGWSISEVVRDYQILRVMLVEYLEETLERRLESRESLVLNAAIDDAISSSVSAFLESQKNLGELENSTRNESLDLLFNVLGVVGHELRNPLAPLRNSLEILRMVGADAEQAERVRQIMERQLRVLGRLVDDMTDLPRLARGKMTLQRQRLDLAQLVRSCAEDRRKSLEASGLSLELDVPAAPVWVLGDETRLNQALGNLIGNAQKFTDSGGSVSVRLRVEDGQRAAIEVQDTGIGIESSVLSKVFEAYMQGDRSLERSRGGLGLGLALVKGVVELHRGSVAASSDGPGTGSTFTLELPLAEPSSPLGLAGAADARTSQSESRRILIIEDNVDSAESLWRYLELHGHLITVAGSGPDGILAAASSQTDVVICDVGLPGMDGYAVANELRRLPVPPPLIIAVTGHPARLNANGRPDEAFDHYLLKPIDPDVILRLLADALPRL
jgi:signal transduction histidine kinase/CheY-like chemotaxis protein